MQTVMRRSGPASGGATRATCACCVLPPSLFNTTRVTTCSLSGALRHDRRISIGRSGRASSGAGGRTREEKGHSRSDHADVSLCNLFTFFLFRVSRNLFLMKIRQRLKKFKFSEFNKIPILRNGHNPLILVSAAKVYGQRSISKCDCKAC